jgi:hypothetical protein
MVDAPPPPPPEPPAAARPTAWESGAGTAVDAGAETRETASVGAAPGSRDTGGEIGEPPAVDVREVASISTRTDRDDTGGEVDEPPAEFPRAESDESGGAEQALVQSDDAYDDPVPESLDDDVTEAEIDAFLADDAESAVQAEDAEQQSEQESEQVPDDVRESTETATDEVKDAPEAEAQAEADDQPGAGPDKGDDVTDEEVDAFLAEDDVSETAEAEPEVERGDKPAEPEVAYLGPGAPADWAPGETVDINDDQPQQTDDTAHDVAKPPDRMPTGDQKVEDLFAESSPIDRGRCYVPSWDDAHGEAEKTEGTDAQYTVVIHGDPTTTGMQDRSGDWTDYDASQLAHAIRSDPGWDGQEPIRLVSCETGKTPADGSAPYAQNLADELGVDVSAPDQIAICSDGRMWSSTVATYTGLDGRVYDIPDSGPEAPNGHFLTFQPSKRT